MDNPMSNVRCTGRRKPDGVLLNSQFVSNPVPILPRPRGRKLSPTKSPRGGDFIARNLRVSRMGARPTPAQVQN